MTTVSELEIDYQEYKNEFARAALVNSDEFLSICTRRSLLPRKCYLSGKKLWMKEAVKIKRRVPLTAAKVIETYWVDSREYMMLVLKSSKR